MELLSRDDFRLKVFERDNHKCVFCSENAADAHHIIERRLWADGGYYLENGVSLCPFHHIEAEKTLISCEDIRTACGIDKIVIPSHLYDDEVYDKWGNIILPNKMRIKGELFFDSSVQKILLEGGVLSQFTKYVKYPRTYHLPWSPGVLKDDRVLGSISYFVNKRVIVTVKMDGENTTLYSDYIHARSIDSKNHGSRDWVKRFHGEMSFNIPEGYRVCGENLYAKHSIHYNNLESYFLMFSIWNDKNVCLSWDETKEWAELLNVKMVPVIYDGIWNEEEIKKLYSSEFNGDLCEGYVVRLAESFPYGAFRNSVAKYVRAGHVGTHAHWARHTVIPNKIKGNEREQ